jgi:hypothetical protein
MAARRKDVLDEDETESGELERRTAKLTAAVETEDVAADDDGAVTDDDVEDEDDEDDEEPETRADRRRNRGQVHKLKKELEEIREQMRLQAQQSMQAQQEQMRIMQQQAYRSQQQPEGDPLERERDELWKRQSEMQELAGQQWAKWTPEQRDKFVAENRRVQNALMEKSHEIVLRRQGVQPQQHPAQAMLAMEYSDIAERPDAHQWATARAYMLRAEGRQPLEAARAALDEARVRFRTAPVPTRGKPSASLKSKLSGQGGGGGGAEAAPVEMTKEMRKMAEARYPDLPPNKAHARWRKMRAKNKATRSREKHA